MEALQKLLNEFAGPPLAAPVSGSSSVAKSSTLESLLAAKNGFFAFEGALWVFPDATSEPYSLGSWNRAELWKCCYQHVDLAETICFALNAFGDQFCICSDGVVRLDAETGELELVGRDLEDWAKVVLSEPNYHLGASLAHDWQVRNGRISEGTRLVPKLPFVLGGGFVIENLFSMDALKAAQMRGQIATQLHEVPDGSTVTLDWTS